MGRIIFDPKNFAPGYVGPRIKREGPSAASAWTSPQGVLTAVQLAKIAAGMRLPSGLRDQGVDAAAEAMKHAATARAGKKEEIEKARQKTRDTRAEISKEDEPALTAEAEGMGADTLKLLRESREENEDKRFVATRVQAQKMIDAGDEDGAISLLTEAGDRVGVTTARMGSEARNRRGDAMKQTEARREKRRYATDDGTTLKYKRSDSGLPAKADLSYDKLGSEAVSTGDRSEDVGSLFADAERLARGDVSSSTIDQGIMKDFRADLDSLRGDGSEEVQKLTREQLRGRLMRWKSGGKAALAKGIAMAGGDQAEVNMMEELLHRQIRRKASLEAGVDKAPKTMTEGQEKAFTEEASEVFMAERKGEDPYYGMRPEDAVKQIMIDGATETSKPKQEKLRALMHKYTPRNQTFSDLFFDNTEERSMGNLRNLNRTMPEAVVEATELETLQGEIALLNAVTELGTLEALEPWQREPAMRIRKRVLELEQLEKKTKSMGQGSRRNPRDSARLAEDVGKSLEKSFAAANNVPALKSKLAAMAKTSGIILNPGTSTKEDYEAFAAGTADPKAKDAAAALFTAQSRASKQKANYDPRIIEAKLAYASGNVEEGDRIIRAIAAALKKDAIYLSRDDLKAMTNEGGN